jgi:malate dehydrogenase
MSRRIAIIGASGAVGSTLAAHLLRSHFLEPSDRLLLVGHGVLTTQRKLLGARIDLLDAFDDERVRIEIVPDICDVQADLVVVAAGATLSTAQSTSRRDLGVINLALFEQIAEQCASRLPEALFIVVSNPVELAVHILSGKVNRHRVLGMGAQQDSLRFARAIATDLGISRHDVRASVLGEHGQAMAPLWRSVELLVNNSSCADALRSLMAESARKPLGDRVAVLRKEVSQFLSEEQIAEAYEVARCALPDARIFVEPFITAHSMHSTPNATANATLQCIAAALANDRRQIHGQVQLQGEVLGIRGVCGIPVTFGWDGWHPEPLDWLDETEKSAVLQCVNSINEFIVSVQSAAFTDSVAMTTV